MCYWGWLNFVAARRSLSLPCEIDNKVLGTLRSLRTRFPARRRLPFLAPRWHAPAGEPEHHHLRPHAGQGLVVSPGQRKRVLGAAAHADALGNGQLVRHGVPERSVALRAGTGRRSNAWV